jgi:hypothetical protein
MAPDAEDWIRLPGLFRWSDVCDLLGPDGSRDFRLLVRPYSVTRQHESLYVVTIAAPGATPSG